MLYPIELRVLRGLGKVATFLGGGKRFCWVLCLYWGMPECRFGGLERVICPVVVLMWEGV